VFVVVVTPFFDDQPSIIEFEDPGLVELSVPQRTMKYYITTF
jgi:hypothetical protein